jgi:hypothetical protein
MNKLLAKEIRLLLPAFGTALVLAIVPVWLLPYDPRASESAIFTALYPFSIGIVLLAISSFGRESALNTFALLLAQPLERSRIWRTKVAVLAPAMVVAFAGWWISCAAFSLRNPQQNVWLDLTAIGAIVALVAFSGGLWTTVLLRQQAAPFWFTILLPATLAMVVTLFGGNEAVIAGALVLYSLAGFWFARRLFFRAEETAWTGGTIALPDWRDSASRTRLAIRRRRPWIAMIRKELQLHQLLLVAMAGLFVMHLGTLAFRHLGDNTPTGRAGQLVSLLCCMLWFVVPLLAGATSVAEERKIGMMEGHLCLPISTRVQYAIKLLMVVLLGGGLSATLFWARASIGHAIIGPADFGEVQIASGAGGLIRLAFLLSAIALLSFYGSSLSRNLMQALMVGIVILIIAIGLGIGATTFNLDGNVRLLPWRGRLVNLIGVPMLFAAFAWLGYRNFRRLTETWRLWRRNLVVILATLALVGTATAAIYNRAWELLSPLEPAHGPARITGGTESRATRITFNSYGLSVLLPDGRLWQSRFVFEPWAALDLDRFGFPDAFGSGKWTSLAGNHFVDGSNWVEAVPLYYGTVAIRQDGTLWVSAKVHPNLTASNLFLPTPPEVLARHGSDTNWKSVIPAANSADVLMLKADGNLYRWIPSGFDWRKQWQGLLALEPYRVASPADWARITAVSGNRNWGTYYEYAWKSNGQAWAGVTAERRPDLDGTEWRSITEWAPNWFPIHTGIRTDGTLWLWDAGSPNGSIPPNAIPRTISRVGRDADWSSIAGDARTLAGLKKDGTLWLWTSEPRRFPLVPEWQMPKDPVRLGTHHDWLALCNGGPEMGGFISLAADGSLWAWRNPDPSAQRYGGLTAPSRKPVKLGNIFGRE